MRRIHDGLAVLLKYGEGNLDAQHDQVFATGPEPAKMAPEDAAKLKELRWSWDASNESWYAFT